MGSNAADAAFEAIDNGIETIHEVIGPYPWSNRRAYATWMAQTYYYTRHASRVSAHAAYCTPISRQPLHEHLVQTLTNEKDHPPMLIDDLRELGFSLDAFAEHPLTSCIYQTLHYQIDTVGPLALIGYFFVIEGLAAVHGPPILAAVREAYDGKACSFLEEHVVADAEHYPQAKAFVRSLADDELATVAQTGTLAASIYRHMIAAIATSAQ